MFSPARAIIEQEPSKDSDERSVVVVKVLSYANVRLRAVAASDADQLFALVDSERERLRRTLPWLDSMRSVHDMRGFLQSSVAAAAQSQARRYLIVLEGCCVGVASLEHLNDEPRVGYWVGQAVEGRGVAHRAVQLLCRRGFADLHLAHVAIAAGVDNIRSRALAERLGFLWQGLRPKAECLYGQWVDHVIYKMSAVAWKARESDRLAASDVELG